MPYLTGNPCPWTIFTATDPTTVIQSIHDVFQAAGWACTSVPAYQLGTFGGNPANGNQVFAGDRLYTFVTSIVGLTDGQVLIGGGLTDSILNLYHAINGDATSRGVGYSSDTPINDLVIAIDPTNTTLRVNAIGAGASGNYLLAYGTASWNNGSLINFGNDYLMWGGWKFRYRSSQGLAVIVYVFDIGPGFFNTGTVYFQVISPIDNTLVGYAHGINIPAFTGQLQLVVNGGGFFCSIPNVGTHGGFGYTGSSVCGGLCQISTNGVDPAPTEAWWSSGDMIGSPFFVGECVRLNLYTLYWPNITNPNEGCWNGTLISNQGQFEPANMRIVPKNAPSNNSFAPANEWSSIIQWDNGDPIDANPMVPVMYDPIVAWGSALGDQPRIRGVIPDGRISSLPTPADTLVTDTDGSTWLCYTDNFIKGGLWLLVNATPVAPAAQQPQAQYRKPLNLGTKP